MKQKLFSLALALPAKSGASKPAANYISGRTFVIEPNENSIETMSFQLKDNICHVTLKTDTAIYQIAFGAGEWQTGETTKRGPYLLPKTKANRVGLPPFKIAGSYRWKNENSLELTLRYIESPHTEIIICHFYKNQILVDFENSINTDSKKSALKGKLKE